jgi:hypothetical protein
VHRPSYGHLVAALRPCWPEHDLCVYVLDILHQLWSALCLQPDRDPGLLSAQAEYQARILPALAAQLSAETTRHGHLDATTDEQQITAWFGGVNDWNLAVATGAPGPGVLDVDQHGKAGTGSPRSPGCAPPGCWTAPPHTSAPPAAACTPTSPAPASATAHLPAHHLDFRSAGGYALVPPSVIGGRPYQPLMTPNGQGRLNWATVTRLLEPARQRSAVRRPAEHGGGVVEGLARWVAAQPEGNRNDGLFWSALSGPSPQ